MSEIVTNLFLNISKYTALAPLTVSNVGELSKRSISFSKDINNVSIDSDIDVSVFSAYSLAGNGTSTDRTLDNTDLVNIRAVLRHYYEEIEASAVTISKTDMIADFVATFPGIGDLSFDTVVQSATGKNYYAYFTFSYTVSGTRRMYNVWCANSVFESTYPLVQYTVVPLFDNLADFWKTPLTVISDIEASDAYEHAQRVQDTIGEYPATGVVWLDFSYVNPDSPSINKNTKWAVIHYGAATSSDTLKQAIVKHLLENDTHTQAQWKTIFPDIFSNSKFVIYPLWNDYAIPNMLVGQTGIFKNNFKLKTIKERAVSYFTDYDEAAIDEDLHFMPMPYKSIAVLSMPGADNSVTRKSIDSVFPDIINVTNAFADFNRMNKKTQDFLNMLGVALQVGETFSNTSTLPPKYYRVVINLKTFIAFTFNSTEYIVAPKNVVV